MIASHVEVKHLRQEKLPQEDLRLNPFCDFVKQDVLSPAAQSVDKENSEESQVSKGELVPTNYESDDSEISEEIAEGTEISIPVDHYTWLQCCIILLFSAWMFLRDEINSSRCRLQSGLIIFSCQLISLLVCKCV